MDKNTILNLEKLGLTPGEAKVYTSLSSLGSSTVGPIVKNSGVAYSNVYDVLNRLVEKGLVSQIIKEKTKYFQAGPPSSLGEYLIEKESQIKEQREILNKLTPKINEIQSKDLRQDAEVFLGSKGLKTAYQKLFEGVTKKDEAVFLYSHDKSFEEESEIVYNSLQETIKGLKVRGICNIEYKNTEFAKRAKHMNLKFVNVPIPGTIDILRDKIIIVSWNPIIAILIHSQDIADKFKNYFEDLWKRAN